SIDDNDDEEHEESSDEKTSNSWPPRRTAPTEKYVSKNNQKQSVTDTRGVKRKATASSVPLSSVTTDEKSHLKRPKTLTSIPHDEILQIQSDIADVKDVNEGCVRIIYI